MMSFYPYSWLFHTPSTTVAISGPIIQVIETQTGDILHVVTDSTGPIRCAAPSANGKHLLTAADNKILKLWKVDGLELVSQRELPKRPTAIRFTADSQHILVSDKFGDVFSYPFHYAPPAKKHRKDSLASHENPSDGQLVLGHASLLNAFLLTKDEKYIITADRDEHIRVSWYPQGYNIEMYCLGHTKYVSAIHISLFEPSQLISGGGDPVLKIWNWMTGEVMHELRILEAIEPYMRIHCSMDRVKSDGGTPEAQSKGRGKKAKGKGKLDYTLSIEDVSQHGPAIMTPSKDMSASGAIDKTENVLIVKKIDTLSHHILFSAVGATALFATPYPVDEEIVPAIHAYDFGQPVLNFFIAQDGLILVTLDANEISESPEAVFVHVLDLSSGKLKFADNSGYSSLLGTLNTKSLHPASIDEIRQLDLYGDLTSMPKSREDNDQGSAPAEAEKQLSKRELGRLKNKKAVLEKAHALSSTLVKPGRGDDKDGGPYSKKIQPDDGQQDVIMNER